MKQFALGIFLSVLAFTANASNEFAFSSLCGSLDVPSIAATPNQQNKMEEYYLSRKYPLKGRNQEKQIPRIPLIDQVYGTEPNFHWEKIPLVERQGCEITLVHQLKSTV